VGGLRAGVVVLVRFPFSDLSSSKLRPALVLAAAGGTDWVLCQITSNPYGDPNAQPLDITSFAEGGLSRSSFARPGKLFTANESIVVRRVGALTTTAHPQYHRAGRPATEGRAHLKCRPTMKRTAPVSWSAAAYPGVGESPGLASILETFGWHSCTGMKRTGSAGKKSSASVTSTDRRRRLSSPPKGARFVVCIDNDGYQASLERNKIYEVLADAQAERDGDLRVIDESGEDYLFAAKRFVAVELPAAVQASVRRAS